MHGIRREYDVDEDVLAERREADRLSISTWNAALTALHSETTNEDSTQEAILKATSAVLLLNPDHYHTWNQRKRAILNDTKAVGLKEELAFNVECIKANPKSYYAWYHRRWFLELISSSENESDASERKAAVVQHELHLSQLLLDLDKRNFHCWNYRRWLTSYFTITAIDEFDYAGRKIFQNFSNYSAWHRRSQLIPAAFPTSEQMGEIIAADLKLVKSAYYTEPADQAAWFYLKWLIQAASKQYEGSEWKEIVMTEIGKVQELLSMDPDMPLALLCLFRLKTFLGETDIELLQKLSQVDPQRSAFYQHLVQST